MIALSAFDVLPVVSALIFPGFVILVVVLIVTTATRQRKRRERLQAYAAQLGWWPIAGPLPEAVAKDVGSRRTKLALGTQRGRFNVWMVWHQWTESTGENSSTTRNLTRYYLWLGPAYPNIELRRRTSIGAFLKPVRGAGTGDPDFDKAFLVRPSDRTDHLRLLSPALRQAMMAKQVPVWQIAGGVLIIGYSDAPRVESFQPRAEMIIYLAHALG
ncbi:MAG TPA: hypothetical protein VH912_29970 [Streptosporangiaceae bacterium]|jgi:hypothetical protein